MRSYQELEMLSRQHSETLMAEAAVEQLAAAGRSNEMRISLRKCIVRAIAHVAARLEPTPIQAELIEACPWLSEWVR
jgi:hypothetical protein